MLDQPDACLLHDDSRPDNGMPVAESAKPAAPVFFKNSLLFHFGFIIRMDEI
ncbi:hypothetical protein [Pontibacter qinzhouensis]|uniref:hypothetical protein n=1 Tax=Pontibacter qinzhouensis TaxID=2603253 RepID=UPI001650C633|nr:hypothetical protein [Pontibacter qinzhouensis]